MTGLAILPTGTIRIAESYAVLAGKAPAHSARRLAIRRAIGHEIVHFIQSISTGFVFDRSEDARKLVAKFGTAASAAQIDWGSIHSIAAEVERVDALLDEQHCTTEMPGETVSARQLMEATAVIESSRQLRHRMTIADLKADIVDTVGSNPLYTRVISLACCTLGDDVALRLTPALVFMALDTPSPGKTFLELLYLLSRHSAASRAAMEPSFILGKDPECEFGNSLIARFKAKKTVSKAGFVNGYGAAFAASGTLAQTARMVAAYPSHVLAVSTLSSQLRDVEKWTAPIILFEDGFVVQGGQFAQGSQQAVDALRDATEILGVMYRVCQTRDYATSCTHTECPTHASALCHLAVPHTPAQAGGDWKDCPFRERFKEWFENDARGVLGPHPGKPHETIARRRRLSVRSEQHHVRPLLAGSVNSMPDHECALEAAAFREHGRKPDPQVLSLRRGYRGTRNGAAVPARTDKREVDFVVLRSRVPLFAVGCKSGERAISPAIRYFAERNNIPRFFQLHLGDRHFETGSTAVSPFRRFCLDLALP